MEKLAGKARPNDGVHAVVAAFHPERELFEQLMLRLSVQVGCVHVVDNTPGASPVRGWMNSLGLTNAVWHGFGDNLGIAIALNEGIRRAIAANASYILLSDQDSLPDGDMVEGLMATWKDLTGRGLRVGAVGPVFADRRTGREFPFQACVPGKFFYGHVGATEETPVVEALTLITSGQLIPVEALRDVGLMREDLFIDKVDFEWCLRARARGWRVFGTRLAHMDHAMGDDGLDVWYFGWRREPAYSPLRIYYVVRNYVALCREKEIGLRWKIRNGWYTFGMVYSQVLFGKYNLKSLRMALRGLWDGARNRMGRYKPG